MGRALPNLSFSFKSWYPYKGHPEERAWSDYCYNFEMSVREYFLSKQQVYSM